MYRYLDLVTLGLGVFESRFEFRAVKVACDFCCYFFVFSLSVRQNVCNTAEGNSSFEPDQSFKSRRLYSPKDTTGLFATQPQIL